MVAYQKSYEKETPCGGWIPWRVCTKTYYKEEYRAIMVPEPVNVTDCCEGYEQVGLYCSLRKYYINYEKGHNWGMSYQMTCHF